MKSLRKAIVMLVVLTMVVASFAACGKKNDTPAGNGTPTAKPTDAAKPTEGAKEEKPGERMEISVIGVDWGYGPLANSEMEQYWEDLFDVTLNIEWVNYEDYHQKVNTLIATGSQPDVIQISKMNSSYYYPIFTQAVDAGQFVDLTPYLFNNGQGLAETNATMKNWDDSMWKQASYKDGIYILPRSKAEIAQQSGVNVRLDLMEKYGYLTEPKTMDELKDWLIGLSNAATEGEGQKVYALEFYGEDFNHDRIKAFATAFTGQMDWGIDKDGNFSFIQFADGYIDFLNWMKDLYDAGVIDPEFSLGNGDTSNWKGGNSVGFLNAWYNWNQSEDLVSNKIFKSSTPDTYKAWCLLPVEGPKGYAISANAYDIDSAIAISSACSEEKIQKILQVFNGTEEAYPGYDTVMADGVEGVHYKLLADGTRDTSEGDMGQKRTEGYVGAWNQIFLKIDADQIVSKFMRDGSKRASDTSIAKAQEIKAFIVDKLAETGLVHANTNLNSETYNTKWSVLTDDVNTYCTLYVMGEITEKDWTDFVNGIVNSADYKKIQEEFKAAAQQ